MNLLHQLRQSLADDGGGEIEEGAGGGGWWNVDGAQLWQSGLEPVHSEHQAAQPGVVGADAAPTKRKCILEKKLDTRQETSRARCTA